ncbi:hypothetical protein PFICI_05428 [Pestalotiopsis fici W106-1]|uniref:Enoyl reductase (ER) domain-containing protein n=1 Tax=Pestalotiopsis fici (strain W106-1 / CGMCC3.15140) TaxID=1229662 RepID=W3XDQ4_PESFW|nr:uncharacterized protein PFICI_05428 [Pestalotiopsis fici W106-1]ETS83552.1 hypothetical protein PFICI_05428 [Pestalotiopsis fici W106-1]
MPKQLIVQSSIEAYQLIDTPIPVPTEDQVVIKVVVAGSNPKDWKFPLWRNQPRNSGDDLAGIVHSVGKNVFDFRPGDRVAAYHEFDTVDGAFAEYSVAPSWTTFHLPANVSFEEGATIPLAAFTAAAALYSDMRLPLPYNLEHSDSGGNRGPLLIYGVTTATGAFAAKLARLSGFYPIVGVAGKAAELAHSLADYVIDYRKGEDDVVAEAEKILQKEGLRSRYPYVLDAVSEGGTIELTLRFLNLDGGVVATLLPPALFAKEKEHFKYPPGVKAISSNVTCIFNDKKDFGYTWARLFSRLLQDGRLTAHPYEVVPGGLHGVIPGLKKLKNGEASGSKYVFRIEDTGEAPVPAQEDGYYSLGHTDHTQSENNHPLRNFPLPA